MLSRVVVARPVVLLLGGEYFGDELYIYVYIDVFESTSPVRPAN